MLNTLMKVTPDAQMPTICLAVAPVQPATIDFTCPISVATVTSQQFAALSQFQSMGNEYQALLIVIDVIDTLARVSDLNPEQTLAEEFCQDAKARGSVYVLIEIEE